MDFKHVTGILQARRNYLVTVTLRCHRTSEAVKTRHHFTDRQTPGFLKTCQPFSPSVGSAGQVKTGHHVNQSVLIMNTHTLSSSKHSNTIHMHRVKQGLFQLCKSSLQSWKWKRNATATQVHDNLSSAAYSPLLDHHRCQVSFLGLSPCCPRRPETPTALWSPWQQHHSCPHQSHVRSTGTVCMVLITAYHNPSQPWTMLYL